MTSDDIATSEKKQCVESKVMARQLDALLFSIEKSILYHKKRMEFFDLMDGVVTAGIIILGSSAAVELFGSSKFLGFVVALVGAFQLTLRFSEKSKRHHFLQYRFDELRAIIIGRSSENAVFIDDIKKRRAEIEKDEPTIYWALEALCYNRIAINWNRADGNLIPLSAWQKMMANFLTFDNLYSDADGGKNG